VDEIRQVAHGIGKQRETEGKALASFVGRLPGIARLDAVRRRKRGGLASSFGRLADEQQGKGAVLGQYTVVAGVPAHGTAGLFKERAQRTAKHGALVG